MVILERSKVRMELTPTTESTVSAGKAASGPADGSPSWSTLDTEPAVPEPPRSSFAGTQGRKGPRPYPLHQEAGRCVTGSSQRGRSGGSWGSHGGHGCEYRGCTGPSKVPKNRRDGSVLGVAESQISN